MRATVFLCAFLAFFVAPSQARQNRAAPVTPAQKIAVQGTINGFLRAIAAKNEVLARSFCWPTLEVNASLNTEKKVWPEQFGVRFSDLQLSKWNWHNSYDNQPVLGVRLRFTRSWREKSGKKSGLDALQVWELREQNGKFRLFLRFWRDADLLRALGQKDDSLERTAIWQEEQVDNPLRLSRLSPRQEADFLALATGYTRAVVARDEKAMLSLAVEANRDDLRSHYVSHVSNGARQLRDVRLVFPRFREWNGQKTLHARALVRWTQKFGGVDEAVTHSLLLQAKNTPSGLKLVDQYSYRNHDSALSNGGDLMRGAIYLDDFESKLATFPRPVPAATQKQIESDISAMLRAHLTHDEKRVRSFWLPASEAPNLNGLLTGMKKDVGMETVSASRFGRWSLEGDESGPLIRVRAWVRWDWKKDGKPDWNERWWVFTLRPRAGKWKIASRWRRADSISQAFGNEESVEWRALIARDEHHGETRRAATQAETESARDFLGKLLDSLRENNQEKLKSLCFPDSPAWWTLDGNLTDPESRALMATLGQMRMGRVASVSREGKTWLEARAVAPLKFKSGVSDFVFITQIERDGQGNGSNWRARRAFLRDDDLIASLGANSIAQNAFSLTFERDNWNLALYRRIFKAVDKEKLNNDGATRALNLCEAALQLAAFLGDYNLLGDAYLLRGALLEANFKGEKAGESTGVTDDYRQSLLNFRAAGNRLYIGFGLHLLGDQASNVAQYDLAEKFELAALKHARKVSDSVTETLILQSLGDIYDALSQDVRAAGFYERARAMAARDGHTIYEIDALRSLGAWQFNRGQIGRGWRILETALQKARQWEHLGEEIELLRALSQAAMVTGQWNEAIARLEQARVLARKLGDVSVEYSIIRNLRTVHGERFLEAGAPFDGSERQSVASRDLQAFGALTADLWEIQKKLPVSLGNESMVAGAYLADTSFNLDIAALRPPDRRATLLAGEGDTLDRMEEYARERKQPRRLAGIQRMRGQLRRLQGRYAEGIAQLEAARPFYETGTGNLASLALLWREMGDNWFDQKNWQKAADAYRASIAQTEKQRAGAGDARLQTGLLAGNVASYQRLAECLLRLQAPPEQVLAAVEAARARALVELMQRGGGAAIKALAHLSPDQKKRRTQLEQVVTKWQKRLDFLATEGEITIGSAAQNTDETRPDAEIAAQTQALVRAAEDLSASEGFSQIQIASRDETRAKLQTARLELDAFDRTLNPENSPKPNAASQPEPARFERLFAAHPQRCIAMFQVGDDATLLILLRLQNGAVKTQVFEIKVARAALRTQIEAARRSFARPSSINDDFSELQTLLLGPIQSELESASELVIVPDDSLATLPFGALNDENGDFLIQKCAVSYAPGLSALEEMEKRAAALQSQKFDQRAPFLGISRSDFPEIGMKALPGTRAEVAAIAPLFGPKSLVAQDDKATKAFARGSLPGARLIHLATHGILNESAPLYSSVALAPDPSDPDGRLYARDLMQMDLSANLVVLSACETALGQSVRGEGILGLTWSIFVAGAPTSIVTQWSVDDTATAALMQKFYAELQTGKAPSMALRDAQLALLKSKTMKHPAFWAPFVLVGASG